MDLTRETKYRSVYFVGAVAVIGSVLFCVKKYLAPPQLGPSIQFLVPQPPISQPNRFPCLSSLASPTQTKRVAIMHGPDWILESSVEPKCLPEREVILSFQEGRYFLPAPIRRRIRFWILNKRDRVYVKIVESSGSEESEDSALFLVTNHKCKTRRAKNCYVSP